MITASAIERVERGVRAQLAELGPVRLTGVRRLARALHWELALADNRARPLQLILALHRYARTPAN